MPVPFFTTLVSIACFSFFFFFFISSDLQYRLFEIVLCGERLRVRLAFYLGQHYTFNGDLGRRCKYALLPKVCPRCAMTIGKGIEGARPSVGKIRALDSLIQSNHFCQRLLSVSTNDMVESIDNLS